MPQKKQRFTQQIQIDPDILNSIKQDLRPKTDIAAICDKYKAYKTTAWTATFKDGHEMDIKLCCGNTHNAESNPLWMEAVLFEHGCEITHSKAEEEFHQVWELETKSARYRTEFVTKQPQQKKNK